MYDSVTMTQAAQRLGVTRVTVRRLVREGVLPTIDNPLDRRQRRIPLDAIKKLESYARSGSAPHHREPVTGSPETEWSELPRAIGTGWNPDVHGEDVEDYLEAHWRPA